MIIAVSVCDRSMSIIDHVDRHDRGDHRDHDDSCAGTSTTQESKTIEREYEKWMSRSDTVPQRTANPSEVIYRSSAERVVLRITIVIP